MSDDGTKKPAPSSTPDVAAAMGAMQAAMGGAQAAAQTTAHAAGRQTTSSESATESESVTPGAPGKHTVGTDLKRIIKEVSKEARKSRVPIYIAVLAACLALVSMAEGDVKERALGAQIEASNKWAYFQAKNIRKTNSEVAAEILDSVGKPELAKKWRDTAARYGSEKKAIQEQALEQQAIREHGLKQSAYFAIAIALLQIAIVLATASLILGGGFLLWTSTFIALLAIFFTFNGYYLYLEFPTDPIEFGKWLTANAGADAWLKGSN